MKGDFTRFTYDGSKGYSGVLMQQGRVAVDADWNEQVEIQQSRERGTNSDVIGDAGLSWSKDTVHARDSLAISTTSATVSVSAGTAYVDGLRVEIEADGALNLTAQPFLSDYTLPTTNGDYVVYLDVWERHVDAVEDEEIREIALGGPDTATRKQLVWQVKLLGVEAGRVSRTDVLADAAWGDLVTGPTGTLVVRTTGEGMDDDPCEVPEEGGYSGLENQLYRVEIHEGNFRIVNGAFASPTTPVPSFLWCRENGSISVSWSGQDAVTPGKLKVSSTGRDENLGFAVGQWVELTDLEHELRGEQGSLAQILDVDEESITIDTTTAIGSTTWTSFGTAPRVRRWSSAGTTGAQPVTEVDSTDADGNWIKLDFLKDAVTLFEGVEIQFDPTKTYRTGDYWMIPARSISGEIAWPEGEAQLPHGPQHHHLMLAIVRRDASGWSLVSDLRQRVVPLNEHLHLFMLGGDGQSAMPEQFLRAPLRVGVSNGLWPVSGARVRFTLEQPALGASSRGGLYSTTLTDPSTQSYDEDAVPVSPATATEVEIVTGADGVALVWWQLGADPTDEEEREIFLSQRVKVELLSAHVDYDNTLEPLHLVVHFTANPAVARDIAWDGQCEHLAEAETVTEAVDLLCENTVLSYVAGDGQSGMTGVMLPVPLTVRVGNGDWGASGVRVLFSLVNPTQGGLLFVASAPPPGTWMDAGTLLDPPSASTTASANIIVETNAEGLASVHAILGLAATIRDNQVKATIIDDADLPIGVTLIFNTTILSSHGIRHAASCTHLGSAVTVFEALERLCQNRWLIPVAGESQHNKAGAVLSVGLRARVSNGLWPIPGAVVQFEILNTTAFGDPLDVTQSGMLFSTNPGSVPLGRTPTDSTPYAGVWYDKFNVVADANGEVLCQWRLGTFGGLEVQRVRATLMDGTTFTTQSIQFNATVVNRPMTTWQITNAPSGGTYPAEKIDPLDVLNWYEFFGLRLEHALIDAIGTGSLSRALYDACLDVEIEVPVKTAAESSEDFVARGIWFRLRGSLSHENETLVWVLDRTGDVDDVTIFETAMVALTADTGSRVLLRVIYKPSLVPGEIGRGSHDVEHRYWMDFTRPLARPDRPLTHFDPRRIIRPSRLGRFDPPR